MPHCYACTRVPVHSDKSAVLFQVNYEVHDNKTAIASKGTINLQVFQKPFATGGCRLAYYAQDDKGTR